MTSKNNEGNGYTHVLDLLIIMHYLCVSYPTRSACRAKSVGLLFGGVITDFGVFLTF